jgi:hypothetical protein
MWERRAGVDVSGELRSAYASPAVRHQNWVNLAVVAPHPGHVVYRVFSALSASAWVDFSERTRATSYLANDGLLAIGAVPMAEVIRARTQASGQLNYSSRLLE